MTKWVCQYCAKEYTQEKRFLSHGNRCPVKLRIDDCRTMQGAIAFDAYNYWMKKTRKGEQTIQTFMKSRFFMSCMRFAEFYLKTSIGPMEKYIDFMIKKNYDFPMWASHAVYAEFIFHYDSIYSPNEQWVWTFDILEQRCIDHQCQLSEVFVNMGYDDVIDLVLKRKLSPWYLMVSPSFWDWLKTLEQVQKDTLIESLRPNIFLSIAQANPEVHKELVELTKEVEA